MSLTEEIKVVIMGEMEEVEVTKRPGMKFTEFSEENARYMAQMTIDQEDLVTAGLEETEMEKFKGYDYLLTETHANRLVKDGTGSALSKEVDAKLAKSNKTYDEITIVSQYAVEMSKDPAAVAAYKKITRGGSVIDKLDDIVAYTSFLNDYSEFAVQIKPKGITYDAEKLKTVRAETLDLKERYSLSQSTETERAQLVDQQNRLITLCLNAQKKLKFFARAAFVDDKAYYDEHYVNKVYQEHNHGDDNETTDEPTGE